MSDVFETPPTSDEFFTDAKKEKFNKLTGRYKYFLDRIVQHGNLHLAAKESGLNKESQTDIDFNLTNKISFKDALNRAGLDPSRLISELTLCLAASRDVYDKTTKKITTVVDLPLKLRTLELILRLLGAFDPVEKPVDHGAVIDLFKKEAARIGP